jgi:hypothetical protein
MHLNKEYKNTDSMKTCSIFQAYFTVLFHFSSLKILLKYLKTVIKDFFFLQFSVKWGWKKIPVIHVDHELDEEVPFVPEKVPVYLDFINFWIRPMSYIVQRLRAKRALPYCIKYLSLIENTYRDAARMYRFRMTTTNRPPCPKGFPQFRTIHLLDSHYLCVPSLHVAICILTYNFFREVFKEIGFSQEEQDKFNKELKEGAIAITESVLYVKQHSVNCIPAALYMMTHLLSNHFSIEEAVKYIDLLFAESTDISEEAKAKIHSHIHLLFEKLLLEGCNEDDWVLPVQRWILDYQPYTN